ncbi:cyclohexanecarboxylate-CoA ligase [Gordonia paraffinivorans]|uniref:AMP-binding protein n=1 Tax=Gordonia paraffinivorans TaxID=175628 RepID=UPI001C92CDF2|nr:AMP-binding protein [Gordonia paraffinivorans]MBY4575630.1 cyclohexanecarboxylate-CoA ligase [Gordonia paraffinivorans]
MTLSTTPQIPGIDERFGPGAAHRFREAGYWADDSLCEWVDRWATESPGHRAVSDGTVDMDYARLQRDSIQVAAWLRQQGVTAGDRVAIQLPNWAEFVVAYVAINRVGAILVPIMPVYREREVRHILQSSEAVVAVTAGTFRDFDHLGMFRTLQAELPSLRQLLTVRSDAAAGPGVTAYGEVVADRPVADEPGVETLGPRPDADAGHAIIYTSGTESAAKGCFHTWNTLGFTARTLAHEIFQMTAADTMYMPSPVSHSTGVVIGIVTPLLVGAGIHLQDVWEPVEGLRRIEQYRCSITATATPFVRMALDAAGTESRDLSSMRAWLCAGAPIPSSLAVEFGEVFTNGTLLPLYGCTEILAATVCRLDDPIERIAGSDGRAATAGVELKTIDADGNETAPGEPGEICYRGPGAILGYWGDPDKTAATIDNDGWHHTGDLGKLDTDGYLRVTGRLKDVIIRGGQNLSSREIEEHLITHPQIRDAAVVAYPDQRLGEKVCAYLITDPGAGLDVEAIRSYLVGERGLAVQKAPERVVAVEEFPMTASGKVQKFLLRQQAAAQAEDGTEESGC